MTNLSLAAGARVGPYEIVSPLGTGGMGEAYRARDTKLNRDVAIKVLPEAFALDRDLSTGSGSPRAESRGERLARFEREAKTLASLNHPHIAQIYGFEESGDVRALVMELVAGYLDRHRAVTSPRTLFRPAIDTARSPQHRPS